MSMNTINFIKSSSPAQHYSLRAWYRIAGAILIFTLLTLLLVSGWKIYRLYILRAHAKALKLKAEPFSSAFERKKKLEDEIIQTTKKIDQLKQLSAQHKQKYSFLKAIYNSCDNSTAISSIRLKNSIETITLFVPHISSAKSYIERLKKETGVDRLIITSFEPSTSNKHGYVVTISPLKRT